MKTLFRVSFRALCAALCWTATTRCCLSELIFFMRKRYIRIILILIMMTANTDSYNTYTDSSVLFNFCDCCRVLAFKILTLFSSFKSLHNDTQAKSALSRLAHLLAGGSGYILKPAGKLTESR